MTTSNKVQTGKGYKWRKGANMKAYWEADIWSKMGKKPIKPEKTSSECSEPDKDSKNS
jgi:hypothetical protein